MSFKLKSLKVDLSKIVFNDPQTVTDGTNGHILEDGMRAQGYPIDSRAPVDLPIAEVKSRSAFTNSMHTEGSITYEKVLSTAYDDTLIKQKLQVQYQVIIAAANKASGKVVDFTAEEIQRHIRAAYENCRSQIKANNGLLRGTVKGGQFGCLEHKPGTSGKGKSYAFRIPHSGMKKLLATSNMIDLGFEFGA